MRIIQPSDEIRTENLKFLLYGNTGVGKTTLAGTAGNAVLVDCENGLSRAIRTAQAVQPDTFEDLIGFHRDPIVQAADVVIFDTMGGLTDLAAEYVKRTEKSARYGNSLSMKGWGFVGSALIDLFKSFILAKKDVIVIAHEKVNENQKGITCASPAIAGNMARQFVSANFDFVGYVSQEDANSRFVDFTADPSRETKNSQGALGKHEIPNVKSDPLFLSNLISKAKDSINEANAANGELAAAQAEVVEAIKGATDVDSLNAAYELYRAKTLTPSIQDAVKLLLATKMKELGCSFDDKTKKFN